MDNKKFVVLKIKTNDAELEILEQELPTAGTEWELHIRFHTQMAGNQAGAAVDFSGFERQRRGVAYVEQNLTAALRVDQVAEALGVSYFSLSRDFKRDTGMGMKKYMELLLMSRARHYLAATDLRISGSERLRSGWVFLKGFTLLNFSAGMRRFLQGNTGEDCSCDEEAFQALPK